MLRSMPAFALLLVLAAPVLAANQTEKQAVQNLEAYAAYKMAQYQRAHEIWLSLAERGNTTAMNNLANMYDQGQGVEQDLATAAQWLTRAAEAGDSIAQLNLGLAYEKGRGVAHDNRIAADWFRRAAEQGEQTAQFNLGVMLATNYGQGAETASDAQREQARGWLQKSAAQGHPEAPVMLQLLQ